MPFCEKPQNLPRLNSWFTKYKVSRRLTTHWHKLVPPYISACTPQCQAVWQYQEMAQKDRDAVFYWWILCYPDTAKYFKRQCLPFTGTRVLLTGGAMALFKQQHLRRMLRHPNLAIHSCPLFALFLVLLHPYGKAGQTIHPTNGQIVSDCFFLIITF